MSSRKDGAPTISTTLEGFNKKVVWSVPALGIKQSATADDVAYPPEDKSGTGKVSGNSPQTTSKNKDTKEEDTSQFAGNRNSESAGSSF